MVMPTIPAVDRVHKTAVHLRLPRAVARLSPKGKKKGGGGRGRERTQEPDNDNQLMAPNHEEHKLCVRTVLSVTVSHLYEVIITCQTRTQFPSRARKPHGKFSEIRLFLFSNIIDLSGVRHPPIIIQDCTPSPPPWRSLLTLEIDVLFPKPFVP